MTVGLLGLENVYKVSSAANLVLKKSSGNRRRATVPDGPNIAKKKECFSVCLLLE
jgi:hypothetical protein